MTTKPVFIVALLAFWVMLLSPAAGAAPVCETHTDDIAGQGLTRFGVVNEWLSVTVTTVEGVIEFGSMSPGDIAEAGAEIVSIEKCVDDGIEPTPIPTPTPSVSTPQLSPTPGPTPFSDSIRVTPAPTATPEPTTGLTELPVTGTSPALVVVIGVAAALAGVMMVFRNRW